MGRRYFLSHSEKNKKNNPLESSIFSWRHADADLRTKCFFNQSSSRQPNVSSISFSPHWSHLVCGLTAHVTGWLILNFTDSDYFHMSVVLTVLSISGRLKKKKKKGKHRSGLFSVGARTLKELRGLEYGGTTESPKPHSVRVSWIHDLECTVAQDCHGGWW